MKVEDETEVNYLCGGELKAVELRKQHQLAQGTENPVKAVKKSQRILHRVLRATASSWQSSFCSEDQVSTSSKALKTSPIYLWIRKQCGQVEKTQPWNTKISTKLLVTDCIKTWTQVFITTSHLPTSTEKIWYYDLTHTGKRNTAKCYYYI